MGSELISEETKKKVLRKMIRVRSRILREYPFFGYLVMHLQLGVMDCGTACTDMKHIFFDPDFAEMLTEEEMAFVMLHEVMHCCLSHCTRDRGRSPEIYNIAADIVVNSNILQSMGRTEFQLAGIPAMHIAPDRKEGYLYSAEEVYEMLITNSTFLKKEKSVKNLKGKGTDQSRAKDGLIDSHEIWENVKGTDAEHDVWNQLVREAGRKYSPEAIPPSVREYIKNLEQEAKADWRALLQDFIQIFHDRFDYSFYPSDRRYSDSDFIMPAFSEQETEKIENLWFCVDTSASISKELLTEIMTEIRQAILLFDHLRGKLSFFDTCITEPVPFENEQEVLAIPPEGGGGTNFGVIFARLDEFEEEEIPSAIIVLTDGLCLYPPEETARDIPVLWIIYDNPIDPPWGRFLHIDLE